MILHTYLFTLFVQNGGRGAGKLAGEVQGVLLVLFFLLIPNWFYLVTAGWIF